MFPRLRTRGGIILYIIEYIEQWTHSKFKHWLPLFCYLTVGELSHKITIVIVVGYIKTVIIRGRSDMNSSFVSKAPLI